MERPKYDYAEYGARNWNDFANRLNSYIDYLENKKEGKLLDDLEREIIIGHLVIFKTNDDTFLTIARVMNVYSDGQFSFRRYNRYMDDWNASLETMQRPKSILILQDVGLPKNVK